MHLADGVLLISRHFTDGVLLISTHFTEGVLISMHFTKGVLLISKGALLLSMHLSTDITPTNLTLPVPSVKFAKRLSTKAVEASVKARM